MFHTFTTLNAEKVSQYLSVWRNKQFPVVTEVILLSSRILRYTIKFTLSKPKESFVKT